MRCRPDGEEAVVGGQRDGGGGDVAAREPLGHPVPDRCRRQRAVGDRRDVQLARRTRRPPRSRTAAPSRCAHCDCSDRMLARVSKLIGPCGLVASHCRSQPRLDASSRSSARASRSRIGRIVTDPSRSVGRAHAQSLASHSSSVPTKSRSHGRKSGPEIVAIAGQLHDRLQVVEPVAGVVAPTAEHDAVHAAGHVGPVGQLLQRVGELDLAALARLGASRGPRRSRGAARSGR